MKKYVIYFVGDISLLVEIDPIKLERGESTFINGKDI